MLPEPDLSPLPCPLLTVRNFKNLLTFLHNRVHPTLQSRSSHAASATPFLTFVVGSGQHRVAPAAMHSHLVGCATAPDISEYHGTLYVPVGPGATWHCPAEWAPIFVYLAAALLWPDLPFLVCSPAYLLGAHATILELRTFFSNPGSLTCFSSAKSLCRCDALLRLPPPVLGARIFLFEVTLQKTLYLQWKLFREIMSSTITLTVLLSMIPSKQICSMLFTVLPTMTCYLTDMLLD